MKRKLGPMLLFALLIVVTPALAMLSGRETPRQSRESLGQQNGAHEGGIIIVFDEATEQTLILTEREYVLGALMCEMPALYEPEALKAQAVAIRTYALLLVKNSANSPDPELGGAAFKVNSATYTGYMTRQGAITCYGDKFNEYYAKMEQAVDDTLGQVLTYEGELISACYHAISPGRTEASDNIFISALPYLVSVDSSWDETSPDFISEKRFRVSEFDDALQLYDRDFKTSGDPQNWLGSVTVSEAGTVLKQTVCDRQYSGTTLREIFALRSAAFELSYQDGEFIFKVKGYGHGVGLSQYGANCMAKDGSTYSEILAHYYPGTALSENK